MIKDSGNAQNKMMNVIECEDVGMQHGRVHPVAVPDSSKRQKLCAQECQEKDEVEKQQGMMYNMITKVWNAVRISNARGAEEEQVQEQPSVLERSSLAGSCDAMSEMSTQGHESLGFVEKKMNPIAIRRSRSLRSNCNESELSEGSADGERWQQTSGTDSPYSTDGSFTPQSVIDIKSLREDEAREFLRGALRRLAAMLHVVPTAGFELACETLKANSMITECNLPNSSTFIPVHPTCSMVQVMDLCGIPPLAVVLGASYFQRLLDQKPVMKQTAMDHGWFVNEISPYTGQVTVHMRSRYAGPETTGLLVIYATCIYIAAKFADRIKYKNLLSAILGCMLDSYVTHETVCMHVMYASLML